jgi:hypothetical protein
VIEVVRFYPRRVIRNGPDKAIFPAEPTKDADVIGLEFPYAVRDVGKWFELAAIG